MISAQIVRIGNSRGVRIPRAVLAQCLLGDRVELEPGDGRLVIRAARRPRAGWEEACRRMAARGDDRLLDREKSSLTRWDAKEWKW